MKIAGIETELANVIVARHGSPDPKGEHLETIAFMGVQSLASSIFRFLGSDFYRDNIAIYTSDSTRAVETAQILSNILLVEEYAVAWQLGEGKMMDVNLKKKDVIPLLNKRNVIMVTHGGQMGPLLEGIYPNSIKFPKSDPGYARAIAVNAMGQVKIIP